MKRIESHMQVYGIGLARMNPPKNRQNSLSLNKQCILAITYCWKSKSNFLSLKRCILAITYHGKSESNFLLLKRCILAITYRGKSESNFLSLNICWRLGNEQSLSVRELLLLSQNIDWQFWRPLFKNWDAYQYASCNFSLGGIFFSILSQFFIYNISPHLGCCRKGVKIPRVSPWTDHGEPGGTQTPTPPISVDRELTKLP